ncbi:putative protein kinase RLK-Pelle-CrRLK1L-1 family [Helianthus annuus]|nr:putative protein kinase RLK-Pelle-CrRLK1L-1 family [Helianthus annuus]
MDRGSYISSVKYLTSYSTTKYLQVLSCFCSFIMFAIKEFKHHRIELRAIKLATNNFDDKNYVGKGGFGKVYKGELVHSEVFCDENDEKIIVYEYASNKSLDLYLSNTNLTWIQRLKICVGAARGLEYLHNLKGTQHRILHRDIKSSNILLDENWKAKISDFGLSKLGPANQEYTFLVSHAVGTVGYCDPLYAESGFLTKESDVYSFGVVLFEVLCGRLCMSYKDKHQPLVGLARQSFEQNRLDEIIFDHIKEQINLESLKVFASIAYKCLKRDREERPTMTQIVKELEIALEAQVWFLTSFMFIFLHQ